MLGAVYPGQIYFGQGYPSLSGTLESPRSHALLSATTRTFDVTATTRVFDMIGTTRTQDLTATSQ